MFVNMGNSKSKSFTVQYYDNILFYMDEVYMVEIIADIKQKIKLETPSNSSLDGFTDNEQKLAALNFKRIKMRKFMLSIGKNLRRGKSFNEAFGELCCKYGDECGSMYHEMYSIVNICISV